MTTFYLTREMIQGNIATVAMSANKEEFTRSLKKASVHILNGDQARELYFLYLNVYNKVCGIPFLKFPEYRSSSYDKYLGEMLKAYKEWLKIAEIEDQKILNAIEDCIAKNKNTNCRLEIGNWTDYIGNRNRFQVIQLQKAVKEMTAIVVKIYYYYGLEDLDSRKTKALYQGMLDFLKNRVKDSLNFSPPKDFWSDKHFPDASVVEDFFHWTKIVRPAPLKDFDRKVEFFSTHDQDKIEKAFLRSL